MPNAAKRPPGDLTIEIASILRGEMARQKMSKQALANLIHISRPQLSKMMDGQKNIDIEELDEICSALKIDLKDVLLDADTETKKRHLI